MTGLAYGVERYEGSRIERWIRFGRFMVELSGPWNWALDLYLDADGAAVQVFRWILLISWGRT